MTCAWQLAPQLLCDVMITLPALVFFVFVQRYLIAGWGAGGVKG
jgi:ABC-type glycerol-3-phosphate transport system permease component